ncbi:hypothetical protein PISMIDRAFT_531379 [Pisolithus microcarpus 441]|uniref:Uncharacterized protein n=1 Tax=Pisolithus microcarpus 441 TaxID=765257 RepID=A0A0C9YAX5_9AGAM|nr:hypothetical protein PISMIDRAFT_531379 [Pisolithus microcarpus 441]
MHWRLRAVLLRYLSGPSVEPSCLSPGQILDCHDGLPALLATADLMISLMSSESNFTFAVADIRATQLYDKHLHFCTRAQGRLCP